MIAYFLKLFGVAVLVASTFTTLMWLVGANAEALQGVMGGSLIFGTIVSMVATICKAELGDW